MNETQFGIMPIKKLFYKLAIPGLIAMVFSSISIMVDGIFVGQFIGSDALAAISLFFPVAMIFFAFGDMIAVGSSVKSAIKLGQKDEKSASQLFSASVATIFSFGLIIMLLGTLFAKDAVFFMIEDVSLATLVYKYANVFILSSPLIMLFFAIDNYLKLCGKVRLSMGINISVALLNIILDALFLWHLGLGIEYAAIATVIGQIIAVLFVLTIFAFKKFPLKFTTPKISLSDLWGIAYNGSSEFFNTISSSLVMVLINGLLLNLGGATAVAAYAIVVYIDTLIVSILYGMQDSIQPAVSYNFGANKPSRILKLFKLNCTIALILSLSCMSMMITFPDGLVNVFANDADIAIKETAKTAILLFAPSYLFTWFNSSASAFLTGLDKPKESVIITLLRAIIFPLILLFLLTQFIGERGVYVTPTISSFLTFIVALFVWKSTMKRIKSTL